MTKDKIDLTPKASTPTAKPVSSGFKNVKVSEFKRIKDI